MVYGWCIFRFVKWRSSEIQDGHCLKIAQNLKKSSHEPPAGFWRNLVGMIDHSCSFIVVQIVTSGSKMAWGVKWGSSFCFVQIWSCHISNQSYLWDNCFETFFVEIGWLRHQDGRQKVILLLEISNVFLSGTTVPIAVMQVSDTGPSWPSCYYFFHKNLCAHLLPNY